MPKTQTPNIDCLTDYENQLKDFNKTLKSENLEDNGKLQNIFTDLNNRIEKHPLAMILLGYCHHNGLGTKRNRAKALECCFSAYQASLNDEDYTLHHARVIKIINSFSNISQEFPETVEAILLSKLANAFKTEKGIGVDKDKKKAAELYKQLADNKVDENIKEVAQTRLNSIELEALQKAFPQASSSLSPKRGQGTFSFAATR